MLQRGRKHNCENKGSPSKMSAVNKKAGSFSSSCILVELWSKVRTEVLSLDQVRIIKRVSKPLWENISYPNLWATIKQCILRSGTANVYMRERKGQGFLDQNEFKATF